MVTKISYLITVMRLGLNKQEKNRKTAQYLEGGLVASPVLPLNSWRPQISDYLQ